MPASYDTSDDYVALPFMNGNLTDIRRQLASLAASRKTRAVPNTKEMPCRWFPGTVLNLEGDQPFTEAGAWEFVIARLEGGEPLELVPLRKPPGRTGYAMKIADGRDKIIYIKLQLGSGRVYGRSFHYSQPGGYDDE